MPCYVSTLAFSQFNQSDARKQRLDSWYSWFWEPNIAGRSPQPGDRALLFAERNAWGRTHNLMFDGPTLNDAIKEVKQDLLFWRREVYERVRHPDKGAPPPGRGKGKGKGGSGFGHPVH